ncbi:hypothetical protein BpHYR1_032133 [Brachionus plicatilis]|uniref:Uncharacterized protein n=1 Tax=Brachionus plicatilis TaxID=10195 RepID=A0A3M7QNU9_BRAPC|nr:hypothetical protein BpHYR1_032133 [Brachionus plicatilis]
MAESLQRVYFKEIYSNIDRDITCYLDLECFKRNTILKRISWTARFFVEKLCNELADCLLKNDVDAILKILEVNEEIKYV